MLANKDTNSVEGIMFVHFSLSLALSLILRCLNDTLYIVVSLAFPLFDLKREKKTERSVLAPDFQFQWFSKTNHFK